MYNKVLLIGGINLDICLLGTDVTMITAFGNDLFSPLLKENLSSHGIDSSISAKSETRR